VRRRVLLLAAVALLAAGCGTAKVVAPLPETVQGPIKKPVEPKGDAAAGKTVFTGQGCGSCHTFVPAGTKASVGPDLDTQLAAEAKKAGEALADFTKTSIVSPNAYVSPGFQPGIMPQTYGTSLTPKQIADLVAFLTQGQK
jgi:mono/diheme cytochrome c family protein